MTTLVHRFFNTRSVETYRVEDEGAAALLVELIELDDEASHERIDSLLNDEGTLVSTDVGDIDDEMLNFTVEED